MTPNAIKSSCKVSDVQSLFEIYINSRALGWELLAQPIDMLAPG